MEFSDSIERTNKGEKKALWKEIENMLGGLYINIYKIIIRKIVNKLQFKKK